MFIILLKFSANRENAGTYMEAHKAWLKQGFDDGVFLLAGSLQPGLGGGILAQAGSLDDIAARVKEDPFVEEDVVKPEIIEMTPALAGERLKFLVG
ncbi:YciI family protein [Aestuariispira insulae]|uniref:Uncharacterized protein YciI n=1 Tax=Aestuariispira insulae TaxID=1461337 RepID=A0A3D9HXL2_9PROT|nr:YciI family protein [Aestuariispira insulae]RED54234.1 uncharacterized protein YciI [Aestuariispira insulae]